MVKIKRALSAALGLLMLSTPLSAQTTNNFTTQGFLMSGQDITNVPVTVNGVVLPLNVATAAVPPSATLMAPSMFAHFADRTYATAVGGRLYAQPQEGVAWGSGPNTGAYFLDPTVAGHAAVPGASRFSYEPVLGVPSGVLVEPATGVNYITSAATFTTVTGSTFSGGADGQASVSASLPALYPGFANIVMLRDSSSNGVGPSFTVTLPSTIHTYTMQAWVYLPATAISSLSTALTPTPASSLCLSSSGTGVSNTKVCANLDKKDVWQLISATIATTTSGVSAVIQLNLSGPQNTLAFSTAWALTALPYVSSTYDAAGRLADSLVSSGRGLKTLGSGSGTLLYSGIARAASTTALAASGGLQATGTKGNTLTLQVAGDPINPTLQAVAVAGSSTVATITGGFLQPGQPFTMALSWSPSGYVYADSLGGVGSATGAIPVALKTLSALPGPNPHTSWAFYPTALTASALQTLVGTGLAVTASADPTSPGLAVPSNFVGLSFENSGMFGNHQFAVLGTFGNSGNSMAALMNLLGSGYIRSGGNSSDGTFSGTQLQATELGTFLPHVPGWKAIVGLNNCQNVPATQATWAAQLLAAVPSITLQIGNEPDLYTAAACTPLAPATNLYGPAAYVASWNTMFAAVRAAAPGVAFSGPDVGTVDAWLSPFLTAESANLSFASRHFYPICAGSGATAPNLLMQDTLYPSSTLAADVALAASFGLKLRMTETNSVCASGQDGVSNRLVSATWAVEYMMQGIAAGLAGVNFHGDSSGNGTGLPVSPYSPIVQASDFTWTFTPLGYGILMISQIQGMHVLPVTSSVPFTTAPVAAYQDSSGSTWFLAVNKSLTQTSQVALSQPGTWTNQSVLTLTGASPTAPAATLGGSSVDNAGNWSPTATLVPRGTAVSIPPASAVLVKLQ